MPRTQTSPYLHPYPIRAQRGVCARACVRACVRALHWLCTAPVLGQIFLDSAMIVASAAVGASAASLRYCPEAGAYCSCGCCEDATDGGLYCCSCGASSSYWWIWLAVFFGGTAIFFLVIAIQIVAHHYLTKRRARRARQGKRRVTTTWVGGGVQLAVLLAAARKEGTSQLSTQTPVAASPRRACRAVDYLACLLGAPTGRWTAPLRAARHG